VLTRTPERRTIGIQPLLGAVITVERPKPTAVLISALMLKRAPQGQLRTVCKAVSVLSLLSAKAPGEPYCCLANQQPAARTNGFSVPGVEQQPTAQLPYLSRLIEQ
jgi:hypothetical protein